MADTALILSKVKLYVNHPVPVSRPLYCLVVHTTHIKQGQLFADIFPIFKDPILTEAVISHLCSHITTTHTLSNISALVCLEARGFFFGPIIASRLGLPCVPVRKAGKLPGDVVSVTYQKEYGLDGFAMKTDAFEGIQTEGMKVIIVDDLLGKGGSVMAAVALCEKLGVEVAESVFIFDVDGPGYAGAVQENLGDLPRYAMVTLGAGNMGAPVNA